MRALQSLKVAVFALLLFLFPLNASTNFFVLSNDAVIDQRAAAKIAEIGTEVKAKLNVNIYVYGKKTFGVPEKTPTAQKIEYIKKYESKLLEKLQKPYVLLTVALDEVHVNLITSEKLNKLIDKNEILNGYVVPLLASKDKNTLFSKTSAAILNGYAAIGDTLAEEKGIKLESSIGSAGKTAGTIWKTFMYFLVLGGLFFYVYAILKRKK